MLAPLVALLAAVAPATSAPARADDRVEEWREDVVHLVTELERLHPDPWFGIPRDDFHRAVDELLQRLPELTDDETVVELMRLVALISRNGRDGHTAVWPTEFRLLPLQLYSFSDGWFVVRAGPAQARLVGARLVRVGEVEVDEATKRIAPLLTRDNDANLLAKLPIMLLATELLHALRITDDPARARLGFEVESGEAIELELAGQTAAEYSGWNTFPPQDLPGDDGALWLQDRGVRFWMEVVDDRALYVHYREIRADDGAGGTLAGFAERMVRRFEDEGLERVVVDVRRNRGGNNTTFGPLIAALRSNESIDRRGRLFVLTGRQTFSAAGNFVTTVQEQTNALLVGEATGGAPNQYGDTERVTLPNHPGVLVLVSTRYHEFGGPADERLTHEPDVPVGLSSEDYFGHRDPVLDAALRFRD